MRGIGLRLCPDGPITALGTIARRGNAAAEGGLARGVCPADAGDKFGRGLGRDRCGPEVSDLGSYSASFVPYSLRDWTPRITLQYNMVRYGSAASGDFDNENLAVSNQWVFSDDRAWSWTATINLSRFTAPHANDHQFYSEVVYDNQITHVQQVCKELPLFFIAAYDLAYHQANPADFDRLDNTLSFSLSYSPMAGVSVGPFVHPSARSYFTNTSFQHDRDDFNISEGLDVTWTPCKYVSLSADFSRADDFSNNADQSYEDTIPGVSVTGTLKF
jgi:hypothetical protein